MRGKIDLTGHKLANLYRPPARRERYKGYRAEKMPDAIYRQLLRLVDGAVRDCFANHPEYLTAAGRRSAQGSIVKRVGGALWGYAKEVSFTAQAVRGHSDAVADALLVSVAMKEDDHFYMAFSWARLVRRLRLVTSLVRVALGGNADTHVPADNLDQRISDTKSAMKAVDHG